MMIWGRLISQSQNPHVVLRGNIFTVGRSSRCNMQIEDLTSEELCRFKYESTSVLEVIGDGGQVWVNQTSSDVGQLINLVPGDEVVFTTSMGQAPYIFDLNRHTGGTHVLPKVKLDINWEFSAAANILSVTVPPEGDVEYHNDVSDLASLWRSFDGPSPISLKKFKEGLRHGLIDSEDLNVSFEEFPYYLSQTTKNVLIASTYIHIKCENWASFLTKRLPSMSSRILLSGPGGSEKYQEKYHETLTKALSKYLGTRLLIVDTMTLPGGPIMDVDSVRGSAKSVRDSSLTESYTPSQPKPKDMSKDIIFRAGDRVMFAGSSSSSSSHSQIAHRGPPAGSRGKVILAFESNPNSKIGVRFKEAIRDGGNDLGGLCKSDRGFFCSAASLKHLESFNGLVVNEIFKVVSKESQRRSLILFLKGIEKSMIGNPKAYAALKKKLEELPENVVVIASHIHPDPQHEDKRSKLIHKIEVEKIMEQLKNLYPCKVSIQIPKDATKMKDWKQKLDRDVESMISNSNVLLLRSVLGQIGFSCPNMETLCIKDQVLTDKSAERAIGWALNHFFMHYPEYASLQRRQENTIVISAESIRYGLDILQRIQDDPLVDAQSVGKLTDYQFEEKILADVIQPGNIEVTFNDIGALENVKKVVKELLLLPLERPEFFKNGLLSKPCSGILLFGPPGTGKTMIAKAVAKEIGATFINITTSSVYSKWLGESENYVKAVFTVAGRLSPSVIFVDEADAVIGQRGNSLDSQARRSITNEFMLNWDGLRTNEHKRVLVLAATNRPFDLDEAVIRRLPIRLMVSLPDAQNREKILKVILAKEKLGEDVDFKVIAEMTDGYSGSDLKNLCVAAAYCSLRNSLEKSGEDNIQVQELKLRINERNSLEKSGEDNIQVQELELRMNDFEDACEEISPSVASQSDEMQRLEEWNKNFGRAGSQQRKKSKEMNNKFEEKLLADVIQPGDIEVTFNDIGASENVKKVVKELLLLPLERPEFFKNGLLSKPCSGILLFGPPGTGKTMIAKAVAKEIGATFINITTSSVYSKWLGESENYVKAVFTVAGRLSPSVIFVDEADAVIGKRNSLDGQARCSITNEFMLNWDGLRTNENRRVLVLAATNRPFDLDDAVIRRLPIRLMVSLPNAQNREKILKVILAKEKLGEDVDFKVIAEMTDGYTGSDLKNLCVEAAYCSLRNSLEKSGEDNIQVQEVELRMNDFEDACEEISPSVASQSDEMQRLEEWNIRFGKAGSKQRKKMNKTCTTFSYFI